MRDWFETSQHLTEEQYVAQRLIRTWNCELIKAPPKKFSFDFFVFNKGNLRACLEIKCRGKKYHTLMVSASKLERGTRLARFLGKKYIVVVFWKTEGIFWVSLDHIPYEWVGWGGREDRSDIYDLEPVIFIPVDLFIPLA